MADQEFDFELRKLEIAIANRQLEIGLFWSRSLYFWGFTAAAFVGYGILSEKHPFRALLVAVFGLVTAAIWTLGNRAGKYWQEAWVQKVDALEAKTIGTVHKITEPEKSPAKWLGAKKR